jgi:hypothetical protein
VSEITGCRPVGARLVTRCGQGFHAVLAGREAGEKVKARKNFLTFQLQIRTCVQLLAAGQSAFGLALHVW